MDDPKIYVTQPSLPPLDEFMPYIQQIWQSRILTNNGTFHQQLEAQLCEHLEVPYISLFSNGSLALITALKALEIKGEVITTPYSFVATAHSILWNGLVPVFVDIDPITLNLDPEKIEAAITPRTEAILPVHVYGNPCKVELIDEIAKKHNLKVIYDAAHAFGVRLPSGDSILKYGDLSVLSFHATKVFNTFEGGAIISKDIETKKYIDQLKNFGFVNEISVETTGINGKMNEFSSALGLAQLRRITEQIQLREKIDRRYKEGLIDVAGIRCHSQNIGGLNNYSYFPVFIDVPYRLTRDELYENLYKNGIYTRRYFYPLITDFPMYSNATIKGGLPVASYASAHVLCLPIYSHLDTKSVDQIIQIIKN